MKKFLSLAILPVLLAGCSGSSDEPKTAGENEPIKIGVIAPLSGQGADWGEQSQRGFDLAAEKVNADGGIGGRPVQLVYQDAVSNESVNALTAFRELVSFDKIKYVLTSVQSNAGLALAPIIDKAEVPVISSTVGVAGFAEGSTWTFNTFPGNTAGSCGLAKLAIEKGWTHGAILGTKQIWDLEQEDAFAKCFTGSGGDLVADYRTLPDDKEFRSTATIIKAKNPDFVYFGYLNTVPATTQMREMGLTVPFITTLTGPDLIAAAGKAIEGTTLIGYESGTSEAVTNFEAAFIAKYGEKPSNPPASNSYDAMIMMTDAMRACGADVSPACVRDELAKVRTMDGASGHFDFDESGGAEQPFVFKVIRGGEIVPFDTAEAPATAETATAPAAPVAKATPTSTAVKTTAFRGSFISAAQPDGWEAKEFSLDAARAGVDFRRMRDGAEAGLIRVKRIPRADGGNTAADQLGKVLREVSGIGYSFDAAALAMLPTDGTLDLALTRADGGAFRLRTRQVISDSAIWTTYLLTSEGDLAETGPAFVAVAGSLGA